MPEKGGNEKPAERDSKKQEAGDAGELPVLWNECL
jgi:hypothetical protein